MDKVKIGIIGTGFSARCHLEAIRRLPGIEVVAIAGSDRKKAEQIAGQFGIHKAYGDAYELIADPEVAAVHNCTPNFLHYPINRAVLLAGKHLLSEKPLAMNADESRELVELANQSPVVSGVCFNYRHYPLVAQIKHMLARGDGGRVHLVHGGYLQDWLLYKTDYNWRLDPERNGASRAIADIGSHWCDTVQYVLGKKITEVFADLKTVHSVRHKPKQAASTFARNDGAESEGAAWEEVAITTEDCGSVLVHFEDGIHGVFTVSQVNAGRKNKLHFEIAAETATFAWDQEEPNRLWIGKRDAANQELVRDPSLLAEPAAALAHYPGGHQEGWPDGLKNLLLEFYTAVRRNKAGERNGTFSFASMEDGHRIMQLIDAILESHRTQKWVRVPM